MYASFKVGAYVGLGLLQDASVCAYLNLPFMSGLDETSTRLHLDYAY